MNVSLCVSCPSLWSLRKFFSVISVSLTSLASGRDKRNLLPLSALSHFRQPLSAGESSLFSAFEDISLYSGLQNGNLYHILLRQDFYLRLERSGREIMRLAFLPISALSYFRQFTIYLVIYTLQLSKPTLQSTLPLSAQGQNR